MSAKAVARTSIPISLAPIKLDIPYASASGVQIVELTPHRLKARDLFKITRQSGGNENVIETFGVATMCDVEPADLDDIDAADYQVAKDYFMELTGLARVKDAAYVALVCGRDPISLQFPYRTVAGVEISKVDTQRFKKKDLDSIKARAAGDEMQYEILGVAAMCGIVPEDLDDMDAADFYVVRARFLEYVGVTRQLALRTQALIALVSDAAK